MPPLPAALQQIRPTIRGAGPNIGVQFQPPVEPENLRTVQPGITQEVAPTVPPEKQTLIAEIRALEQQYINAGGKAITEVASVATLMTLPLETLRVLRDVNQGLLDALKGQQELPPETAQETEATQQQERLNRTIDAIVAAFGRQAWQEAITLAQTALAEGGWDRGMIAYLNGQIQLAEERLAAEAPPTTTITEEEVTPTVAPESTIEPGPGLTTVVGRDGLPVTATNPPGFLGAQPGANVTGADGSVWEWNGSTWNLTAGGTTAEEEVPPITEVEKAPPVSFTQPPSTPGTTVGQQIAGTDGSVWGWNGTTWVLVPPTDTGNGGGDGPTDGGGGAPTEEPFSVVIGQTPDGFDIVRLVDGTIGFWREDPVLDPFGESLFTNPDTGEIGVRGAFPADQQAKLQPLTEFRFQKLGAFPAEREPSPPTAQEVAAAELESLFRLRGGFEPGAFRRVEDIPGFLRSLIGPGERKGGIGPGGQPGADIFGFGLGQLPPFKAEPTRPFLQQLLPQEIAFLRAFAEGQGIPFETVIEQAERLTPLSIEQRIPAIQKKVLAQQRR